MSSGDLFRRGRIVKGAIVPRSYIPALLLLSIILLIGIMIMKPAAATETAPLNDRAVDMYSELLAKFVNDEGLVNYDSLRNDRTRSFSIMTATPLT